MSPISRKTAPISAHKPLAAADTSTSHSPSDANDDKTTGRMHKRSRSGCFTCRLRRKKCNEAHPTCGACGALNVVCSYKRPSWWGNPEDRRKQKENLKRKIKQTKMQERSGHQSSQLNGTSSASPMHDFNRPVMYHDSYDLLSSQLPTPGLGSYGGCAPTYEVDVRTERQTFVNDVPLRHDSSTSTFNTFAPPHHNPPMPTFAGDGWFDGDEYFVQATAYDGFDQGVLDPSLVQTYSYFQPSLALTEGDQELLDHFLSNVLRHIFPVLEAHGEGPSHRDFIFNALQTNKCYLHCCLSVAAIHRKTSGMSVDGNINHDDEIMRHRFAAITQLCQALNEDVNHEEILDATLAMILFHCSVGPAEDHLPDVPWYDHFQAASNLVNRLGLQNMLPQKKSKGIELEAPFSMRLTWWIDILGSTMVGNTPQFAHQYRIKYQSGETTSDLRELMGCKDQVMYLISEITCLDSLKIEGRLSKEDLRVFIYALNAQLDETEDKEPGPKYGNHFDPATGMFIPENLTKTITHIFRTAARIYLFSLAPPWEGNKNEDPILISESWINEVTQALETIPTGPDGFDRSLVWPLLMTGVASGPHSSFRAVLAARAAKLGDYGDIGSFGRMYRLLQEVWRLNDCPIDFAPYSGENPYNSSLTNPISKLDGSVSPSGAAETTLRGREIKKQPVHWRDVMKRNNWQYLLI